MHTHPLPQNSYDEIPYESFPYSQAHPSNLFTIATLFGLTPPQVETARVLELGCAAGGNLIPMAESLPQASFVGVDLSSRQVGEGQKMIAETEITNATLRHASILDVEDSYGIFDYVICHGVFSWVPGAVQEKILSICAKNLASNGVAYVSYNVYPGWHMRGIIRDMMLYHSHRFASSRDRIQQARSFLNFLAETAPQDGHYSALLRYELDAIQRHSDQYLYHDHLEAVNEPLYFHQFVERASGYLLQYLGDARIGTMMPASYGPEVARAIKLLSNDQVQIEQYLDFFLNRSFRETLLVHGHNVPDRCVRPERVKRLHFASGTRPTEPGVPAVRSNEVVNYRTPDGLTISTDKPLLKSALAVMGEVWPGTVSFEELVQRSFDQAGCPADVDTTEDVIHLAGATLGGYLKGDVVELRGTPVRMTKTPGERPLTSKSARFKAAQGRLVTNQRHEIARLSQFETQLLALLDGTRDLLELKNALVDCVVQGRLRLSQDGQPITVRERIALAVEAEFQHALENIASQALLVRC